MKGELGLIVQKVHPIVLSTFGEIEFRCGWRIRWSKNLTELTLGRLNKENLDKAEN